MDCAQPPQSITGYGLAPPAPGEICCSLSGAAEWHRAGSRVDSHYDDLAGLYHLLPADNQPYTVYTDHPSRDCCEINWEILRALPMWRKLWLLVVLSVTLSLVGITPAAAQGQRRV